MYVEFVVEEVALGLIFLQVFSRFLWQHNSTNALCSFVHPSTTPNRRYPKQFRVFLNNTFKYNIK
jgi:hypothetical protein